MSKHLGRFLTLSFLFLSLSVASGEPKKPEKKVAPRAIVAAPLGIVPGQPTRVIIRGLKLDSATEVKFQDAKVMVKLLSKGKVPLPAKQEAVRVGDTQVEVQVTLPPEWSAEAVSFTISTSSGETMAHKLLVETKLPVVAEKEPNNGFRQAQPIQFPQVVDGAINQPQDVDVFRFEGKEGQRVVFEVLAARHGSALDSLLTLYDAEGRILASNDDSGDSVDSRLETRLPKNGAYFISVADAHDQGGPAHVYRLVVKPQE